MSKALVGIIFLGSLAYLATTPGDLAKILLLLGVNAFVGWACGVA